MLNKIKWLFISLVALVLVAVPVVYAIEAETELRIICGVLKPGTSSAETTRVLKTLSLSSYESSLQPSGEMIEMTSLMNLKMTRCEVILNDGVITRSTYSRVWP